jgi:hypothetical protein
MALLLAHPALQPHNSRLTLLQLSAQLPLLTLQLIYPSVQLLPCALLGPGQPYRRL